MQIVQNEHFLWKKILTREFSFLYVSHAIDALRTMQETVGTTLQHDFFHGVNELCTIYRTEEDIQNSYKMIDDLAASQPQKILTMMDRYDAMVKEDYKIMKSIDESKNKEEIRKLLLEFDQLFLDTLRYYLFWVYLGYGGDYKNIKAFLNDYEERFEHVRNLTIDIDADTSFVRLYSRYDATLGNWSPYMNRQEIVDVLHGGKLDLEHPQARKKEYLLVMKYHQVTEYFGADISNVLQKELSHLKIDKNTKALKGRIACEGRVEGAAKIIFSRRDYSKIAEGDIVVTPMTKPDIVPFLSKAAGIVTNDGGALCHASIVSREMNIPCIVGTVNATDIFKDGDRLDLDASQGVVTKMSEE